MTLAPDAERLRVRTTSSEAVEALRERGLRLSTSRRLVLAALFDGRRTGVGRAARPRARARADLRLPQPRDARAPRPRAPRPPRPRPGPVRACRRRRARVPVLRALRRGPRARAARARSGARGGPRAASATRSASRTSPLPRHLRRPAREPALARKRRPTAAARAPTTRPPSNSATRPAPARSISIDSSRHARATGATRAVGPQPDRGAQLVGARAHVVERELAERAVGAADEHRLLRGPASRSRPLGHRAHAARRPRPPRPGRRRSRRRRRAAARARARAGRRASSPAADRLEQPPVLEHAAGEHRRARCRARRPRATHASTVARGERARGSGARSTPAGDARVDVGERPRGSSRADRSRASSSVVDAPAIG